MGGATRRRLSLAAAFLLLAGVPARAGLVASYGFNNTLAADQGGVPALTATDPLGTNGFVSDTVLGYSRTVYAFNGNPSPVTDQAGLTFDNSGGLIPSNNYSVEMIFEFSQRDGAWRRIMDVNNRQSDNGLYIDPSNHLDVFPVVGSSASWTNNAYHQVVFTQSSGGTMTGYLDGVQQFSAVSTVMDINNPQNVVNFFLDNVVGGGQGEYSSGRVAQIQLYDSVLSQAEVTALHDNPFPAAAVPEPSTAAGALTGLVPIGLLALRRLFRRA
jgi:hypothetical protein